SRLKGENASRPIHRRNRSHYRKNSSCTVLHGTGLFRRGADATTPAGLPEGSIRRIQGAGIHFAQSFSAGEWQKSQKHQDLAQETAAGASETVRDQCLWPHHGGASQGNDLGGDFSVRQGAEWWGNHQNGHTLF